MKFKITAIKPLEILVMLSREVPHTRGTRPESFEEWVQLKPNESQDGVTMVIGVDPKYIPAGVSPEGLQSRQGRQVALIGIHGKVKREIWGLFVLEPSSVQE
jgi:hypothetical protein